MRRAVMGACAVSLALAAAGVARPAAAATKPPAHWDPRVTTYVKFVEKHRKLKFEHPVPVEFLDDAAFVKKYQADDPKITKKDRADAEQLAGQMRALGLIQGPVDLIGAQQDLDATGTVGFYDQEKKALYVRGTDLSDIDVRVTLVHELTHALQDQRFDLTKLDEGVKTSGDDFALTALVEGDATSVEDAYLFSRPQAEQDAYFAVVSEEAVDDEALADVPSVLELFSGGPYVFGSRYIEFLRDAGGQKRIDHAFVSPPHTEEQIIDPMAARGAEPATRVATPKLAFGERRRGDADDFGALSLYFVLASRIDPQVALRAAEGWGGDRSVGFTKRDLRDQECVRIRVAGDTTSDTLELADAFRQWVATLPFGSASTASSSELVDLTACDTGGVTAPSVETIDAAIALLVNRNDIALELLAADAPAVTVRCEADHLAGDPAFLALYAVEGEFTQDQEDQFSELLQNAATDCSGSTGPANRDE